MWVFIDHSNKLLKMSRKFEDIRQFQYSQIQYSKAQDSKYHDKKNLKLKVPKYQKRQVMEQYYISYQIEKEIKKKNCRVIKHFMG